MTKLLEKPYRTITIMYVIALILFLFMGWTPILIAAAISCILFYRKYRSAKFRFVFLILAILWGLLAVSNFVMLLSSFF